MRRVLSKAEKDEIRAAYPASSARELAKEYQCSHTTILRVIRGRTDWSPKNDDDKEQSGVH